MTTTHFTASHDITVPLPPPEAMALFTPEGEQSWAGKDGWNPRYPALSRTTGAGQRGQVVSDADSGACG